MTTATRPRVPRGIEYNLGFFVRLGLLLGVLGGIGAATLPAIPILGYGLLAHHDSITSYVAWLFGWCQHSELVSEGIYGCGQYGLPVPLFEPAVVMQRVLGLVGLGRPPKVTVDYVVAIIASLILLHFVVISVTLIIYILRKVIGYMQARLGPMRVGPKGILQTLIDAVKLLAKEDTIPGTADKVMFTLAPVVVFIPALLVYVVVPFGDSKGFIARDLNIGILYVVAMSSITVIGIILAGWASDNKYALFGAMRAAAQLVSYEVPGVLVVLGPVIMAGSLGMRDIILAQKGGVTEWFIWSPVPLVGFLVYLISSLAETNITPFDLPEAESELVSGYNVEYSGMKFGLFFLAEFANSFTVCFVAAALFLGGWYAPPVFKLAAGLTLALSVGLCWIELPFLLRWALAASALAVCLGMPDHGWGSLYWMMLKASGLQFLTMWIRATYPRVRVDQLMEFAWKGLIPISLVYLAAVGLWAAINQK